MFDKSRRAQHSVPTLMYIPHLYSAFFIQGYTFKGDLHS